MLKGNSAWIFNFWYETHVSFGILWMWNSRISVAKTKLGVLEYQRHGPFTLIVSLSTKEIYIGHPSSVTSQHHAVFVASFTQILDIWDGCSQEVISSHHPAQISKKKDTSTWIIFRLSWNMRKTKCMNCLMAFWTTILPLIKRKKSFAGQLYSTYLTGTWTRNWEHDLYPPRCLCTLHGKLLLMEEFPHSHYLRGRVRDYSLKNISYCWWTKSCTRRYGSL